MVFTVQGVLDCLGSKRAWLVLLLLGSMAPAYGQDKLQTPQETNERIQQLATAAQGRHGDNTIGSGDLLHIDVYDVPDLSRDVRVSDSGMISLPLIPGRIQAGGLTTYQLEQKLAELLITNGLVTHPQVSVFVREQNSQPVSVVGAVNRPTVHQVIRPTTLLEVLAQAGGIADDAGAVVLVTRPVTSAPAGSEAKGAGDPQTITIRLRDLLDSGDPQFNIRVFGGDVVSVPRGGIIYVAGAVQQPGGFVLQNMGEQMTTLKALALARGLLSSSKPDKAVILRRNPDTGEKKEIEVDLKKIMRRKAEDIRLYANDVLFVPDSTGRRALYRAGEAALSVTTGLVILRAGR
jgi:polysaccharide export outer membrane protein